MLPFPLGLTAFISGKTMFDILPRELQSVAVRARVRYVPHPFEWMTPATAHSTGLTLNELPPWTEDKMKVLPVVRVPFPPFLLAPPDLTSSVSAPPRHSSVSQHALYPLPQCAI